MTTKYEQNSKYNKFGTFSFRHEIEHQKRIKSSCECENLREYTEKREDKNCDFTINEIYKDKSDVIPMKSELYEPKMKTVVNLDLNKQRLKKIINKKEW